MKMKLLSFSTLLLLTLVQLHQSNSHTCNKRVTPGQFLADPSTFRGVSSLTSSTPGCTRDPRTGFTCVYDTNTILGDNAPVPSRPSLENSGGGNTDIGKFLVWPSSTDRPYMNFALNSAQSVTAINIEFLNYPAQNFSLPNLELYEVATATIVNPNNAPPIEFDLQNNNVLSQDDYQITSVSLIFPRISQNDILIRWNYTGVYNLDFFMVSEVDFCNDAPSTGETQITFQYPQSDNLVVRPTVEELTVTRTITLNCTVSSSGLFEWQWRQNGNIISNNGRFSLFTADGTRTGILQITGLNVSDAAVYTCEVRRRRVGGEYMSRMQTLSSEVIDGTDQEQTGPTSNGGDVTNSTSTGGGSGPGAGSSGQNGQAGIIAGVVIGVILVIVVSIVLVVLLIYIVRSRDIHFSLPRPKAVSIPTPKVNLEPLRRLSIRRSVRKENLESSVSKAHQNGGSTVGEESSQKKRLTKADIEWQLPHIDNLDEVPTEAETALIYSEVSKPKQEEEAPPIPPQNFDPQEAMTGDNQSKAADHHHYENEGFTKAQRRLTNTSSPKLAKKKLTASESEGLDTNPLYEPAKEAQGSYKEGSNGTSEGPIYAQPNLPDQKSVASNSEPIYSEAIHPELFSQGPEAPQESTLTPVAPMYAELQNLSLRRTQPPLKIPAFKIKELRPLGVGQFGEVMLAETVGLSLRDLKLDKTNNKRSIRIKVAVKKLRPQAGNQVRENFEKEINFMSKLKDDNIVRLLAVSKDDPPFIVMEYMENGDLHQFLQEYEPSYSDDILQANQLPVSILLYMAVQIASGMRYLASLRYVHRDLATRNCLVGQNFVVKISDFGMSRSLYESSYYRVKGRAMLPIRWMASESFYGRFSEKTDVWSYGVTMWEIFTLAKHQPYEEIDDQEVIQDAIRGLGRRLLEKPKFCPMEVYKVMLRCWEYAPDDRANFEEVFNTLAAIHQSL